MAAAGSALAEVFLAHLPAPARGAEIDRAALERGLDELCARGSDAWPAVPQARERFVGHVAERLSGDAAEPDPVAALARLHAGDLWLASACAAGDRAALAAFDRQFLGDLARYLARRSPASLLEDLQQQLRTRLLVADEGKPPRIAGYTGRGPLGAWLRVAAARLAINMQQARATRTLEPAIPPTPDEGEPDPELAYMRGRYGPALRAAVSGAIAALDSTQATVLRLFFLHAMTIEAIAATLKVSGRTVRRWVADARARILEDTGRRLREDLRLTETQLQSVIRVARTEVDPSVVNLLQGREPPERH